ncbi:sigma-E processing peptidase SpoIIGA [Thalassobacillus sp. C254]|uniref:sigma-E processing peptidase SpoIIGA n=1 Tax=Thalassobacillus sp. C254 TaxID=1225341 RepID=UPI0035B548C8
MNIILLLLTARFLKRKISMKRLLIVAAVSSSTVFLILTPLEGFFLHPLGKFLLSVGVVIGTFGFYNFSFLFPRFIYVLYGQFCSRRRSACFS